MPIKLLAFDLDDTLAVTKSPVDAAMADRLDRLLGHYELAIISGGRFEQFETQLLRFLRGGPTALTRVHILPTSGTRYYRFDPDSHSWQPRYVEDLSDAEKEACIRVLTEGALELGLLETDTFGPMIEDRGSQITFSALGQEAPPDRKYAWDPDGSKKRLLRDYAAPLLPELSVRTGGSTSVDVTRKGIDKAHGMLQLMQHAGFGSDEILFFGDQLRPNGNDYPVRTTGIRCIEVRDWHETATVLDALIAVSHRCTSE